MSDFSDRECDTSLRTHPDAGSLLFCGHTTASRYHLRFARGIHHVGSHISKPRAASRYARTGGVVLQHESQQGWLRGKDWKRAQLCSMNFIQRQMSQESQLGSARHHSPRWSWRAWKSILGNCFCVKAYPAGRNGKAVGVLYVVGVRFPECKWVHLLVRFQQRAV